jgi:hypothetical protein
MPETITDPYSYSLLVDDVRAREQRPLVNGDFSSWRFQILNDAGDDAEDLDGWTFQFVMTDCQGEENERDSETELAGHSGTNEIEIDDQDTGNETSDTGKGWVEVFFSNTEDFSAFADPGTYKLIATPPNDRPYTVVRGEVSFLQ